jgi:hypothetical protein
MFELRVRPNKIGRQRPAPISPYMNQIEAKQLAQCEARDPAEPAFIAVIGIFDRLSPS